MVNLNVAELFSQVPLGDDDVLQLREQQVCNRLKVLGGCNKVPLTEPVEN